MTEISKAVKIIKENLKPKKKVKKVNIINAINKIVAQDIFAQINLPPFDKSPYDGYAYNADINGLELDIVGEIYAGDIFNEYVHKNQCVKIMTGSKMPLGTNCVIKKEDTVLIKEDKIKVKLKLNEYDNYIFEGEDIKKGQLVIRKGDLISNEIIGLLASLGIEYICVYEELKVAILNTGTEIQSLDEKLKSGKIYNSNRYILLSKLKKRNIEVTYINSSKDELCELEVKIKEALTCSDILITTGGVSVGDKDLIPKAFKRVGGKELFYKVKTKPGGACCFSVLGDKLLCGLSGNPHAAIIIYENILVPAMDYLSCMDSHNIIKAFFKGTYDKISTMDRYINGNLYAENAKLYVKINENEKSKLLLDSNSNCMIKINRNTILNNNDIVEVIIM